MSDGDSADRWRVTTICMGGALLSLAELEALAPLLPCSHVDADRIAGPELYRLTDAQVEEVRRRRADGDPVRVVGEDCGL